MKIQTRIPKRPATPEERARLDRERAIVTAIGAERSYRIVNGLGTEYRVIACSACDALRRIGIPGASFSRLQVLENGTWTYVI